MHPFRYANGIIINDPATKQKNITIAMNKNKNFVMILLAHTVNFGQYLCTNKSIGANTSANIFKGGGANISIPNHGSHSILKYVKIRFVL